VVDRNAKNQNRLYNHCILREIFSLKGFTQDKLDIILPKINQNPFGKGEYLMEEGLTAQNF